MKRLIVFLGFCLILFGISPRNLLAYDTSFTLSFDSAGDTSGWSDPVNTPAPTFVTGETTPADSPAYSPTPDTGAGYDSTGWMRIGQAAGDNYGVSLAIYDGAAGGNTSLDPTDYTIEADVFIPLDSTNRNQEGLVGRWTSADTNFPFEVFYSKNTPSSADGYGWRGGGSTASYGQFTTESTNRWVRMRMYFHGGLVDVAIDNNLDGTFDYSQTDIALTDTAGKAGFFSVINDPTNGSLGVANQFSYFDNLSYTPVPTEVKDWTLF